MLRVMNTFFFSDVICGIGAVPQYLFTIPRVTVFFLDNSDKEEEPTGIHHHLSSSATLKHCALSLIHVALYVAIVKVVSPLIVTW